MQKPDHMFLNYLLMDIKHLPILKFTINIYQDK